jgi:hypothetical protein
MKKCLSAGLRSVTSGLVGRRKTGFRIRDSSGFKGSGRVKGKWKGIPLTSEPFDRLTTPLSSVGRGRLRKRVIIDH